jgi:triosephosphate isomerase
MLVSLLLRVPVLTCRAAASCVRSGSVTGETVDELMRRPDIDGCLVGGASLAADSFGRIMNFQK